MLFYSGCLPYKLSKQYKILSLGLHIRDWKFLLCLILWPCNSCLELCKSSELSTEMYLIRQLNREPMSIVFTHFELLSFEHIMLFSSFVKLESKIFLQEYLGFILAISESIRGKKIRDPDLESFPTVQKLLDMLVILRHLSNLV